MRAALPPVERDDADAAIVAAVPAAGWPSGFSSGWRFLYQRGL